jgi:hypothetical protein
MSDPEALVTIADLDKAAATDIVATGEGAQTAATPAETTVASATTQTEAPTGEEAPAEQSKAEPPDWFVREKSKLQRQRRDADRRAERLAAELEALKRVQVQPQRQSAELRPQDFPNYDAYVEAKIEAKTDEKIGALARSRSEQEAQGAVHNLREAFLEKATEQAEAADIDLEAVMETLGQAPLLSPTVLEHLAKSEQPARLAEWLAENPGELDRVSRLGPALAKKSLAKVEASFTDAKPKPNATKAPPPVPPVGGRAVTNVDPSKLNMDDYAAYWRKRQEAQSG